MRVTVCITLLKMTDLAFKTTERHHFGGKSMPIVEKNKY